MASRAAALRTPKQSEPSVETKTEKQPIEDRIRIRAYELYLERGQQDGAALEDWTRAEAEILGQESA